MDTLSANNRKAAYLLAVTLFLSLVVQAGGATIEVVAPNDRATLEGNSWTGGGVAPFSGRFQTVYDASQFSALSGPMWLAEIRTRPDGNQITGPRTVTFDDLEVWVSTTSVGPGNLSPEFDANHGPDRILVKDGPWTVHTDNVGPPGGPKVFDYVFTHQPRLLYDPAQGNFLIDVRYVGLTPSLGEDWHSPAPGADIVQHSGTTNPDSTSGTVEAPEYGAEVYLFIFLEPLPGDMNGDSDINHLDVAPFTDHLLNGPYHISADMNEDGVIDGLDCAAFVDALRNGGSNETVPEPSTLMLAAAALLGLLVISGLRRWRQPN